jgi:hypothetical protein
MFFKNKKVITARLEEFASKKARLSQQMVIGIKSGFKALILLGLLVIWSDIVFLLPILAKP